MPNRYGYDYGEDPHSEERRYYAQGSRQMAPRQGSYEEQYNPQDPSGYHPTSSRPRGYPIPEQPSSTWDSYGQSTRERSHYTHTPAWSDETQGQYAAPLGDEYYGGYAPGYGQPAQQQTRAGRSHSQTHSMYAPPSAQSTIPRASYGDESNRSERGRPAFLSSHNILDPRYVIQPTSYFRVGKVFAVLWHENYGGGAGNGTVASRGPEFIGRFGQAIYSTIRRMVAIKVFDQCSWCIAINTYGRQGVAKRGVDETKHAIVHMRGTSPMVMEDEPPMIKEPLVVNPDDPVEGLDPRSRLNFGKIYTVEHNVKVLPIGTISNRSMTRFRQYASEELAM